MPVEIRELNIRIHVNQNQPQQDEGGAKGAAAGNSGGGGDKEEIIAECVEQVMELLKHKQER